MNNPLKQQIADKRRKLRSLEERHLRGALPKGTDFSALDRSALREIATELNWSTGRVQKTAERIARRKKK